MPGASEGVVELGGDGFVGPSQGSAPAGGLGGTVSYS